MGPLERAKTTATLAANVEARLSEELGQSAGEVAAGTGREGEGRASEGPTSHQGKAGTGRVDGGRMG